MKTWIIVLFVLPGCRPFSAPETAGAAKNGHEGAAETKHVPVVRKAGNGRQPGMKTGKHPSSLARDIQNLNRAEPQFSLHLGVASPMPSPETTRVVSHGKAAIPLLLKALENDNALVVGHAVQCLWEMEYFQAKRRVEHTKIKFASHTPTAHQSFALTTMDLYLRAAAHTEASESEQRQN